MCGIAGYFSISTFDGWDTSLPEKMGNSIAHRGPDAHGFWSSGEDGVTLIHRRLSILDLSEAGAQPMSSHDGRYVMSYNGEVYNSPALSDELKKAGVCFKGHSDTEVMLELIARKGLYGALPLFNGMFAFALWDKLEKKLYLVRDRLGVKPLYYSWGRDGSLIFASELKAISAFPHFRKEINPDALPLFFRHNYIPAPLTIYKDSFKLPPGYVLEISKESLSGRSPVLTQYWNPVSIFLESASLRKQKRQDAECIEELEPLLADAAKSRMISDVPLGAFLSGGIDSSLVTAMMCKANSGKVKTFSIGFEEDAFNEATFAKLVANHLGTEHTELYVKAKDALDAIPLLPEIWDEPFADSSQIPTYLLSKLTRNHVTVALSGDGGDELFHGYTRYKIAERLLAQRDLFPSFVRKPAGLFRHLPPSLLHMADSLMHPALKMVARPKYPCRMLFRALEMLSSDSVESFYGYLASHQLPPGGYSSVKDTTAQLFSSEIPCDASPVEKFALLDILSYLPDDILVKVDRASMAVALESRNPLLDYRIAEYAMTLHPDTKDGKKILKKILYKYVPQEMLDRPKTGFGIPLGEWLSGPLRDWSESMLSEEALARTGFLNVRNCRDAWKEHSSGTYNHQYSLWNILMFQAWHAKYFS